MIAIQVNRLWWMEQNPHVLPVSVQSIRKSTPSIDVVVVGDNRDIEKFGAKFVHFKDYYKTAARFEKVYVHGGNLPEEWQRFTITRWLILADYVEKSKIKEPIFTCDHDVISFADWTKEGYRYKDADYTYSLVDNFHYSACEGFVNNANVLRAFSEFIIKYFQDGRHPAGHEMNDMHAWRKFSVANPKFKWANTIDVVDGAIMDRNVADIYRNYENDGKTKLITFEDGRAYCLDTKTGNRVRFLSLHCWGPWKNRMQYLVDCAERSKREGRIVPAGTC
jgi:hypothetical protein